MKITVDIDVAPSVRTQELYDALVTAIHVAALNWIRKALAYHPDSEQMITTSSDREISLILRDKILILSKIYVEE